MDLPNTKSVAETLSPGLIMFLVLRILHVTDARMLFCLGLKRYSSAAQMAPAHREFANLIHWRNSHFRTSNFPLYDFQPTRVILAC
jgi:hypothetical protein